MTLFVSQRSVEADKRLESVSIRFVTSADAISPDIWDVCFPPPLEGRWWYETLEASQLEDQFEFLYALIYRGPAIVGIAPLFVMNVPIELVVPTEVMPFWRLLGKIAPSLMWQRTLFVGSPCSDEGHVGLMPGIELADILQPLQDALKAKAAEVKARMLVWKDFPNKAVVDLAAVATKNKLFRVASFPGAVVHLPSKRKDDYFAALKASRRQKLKRKLRNSAAEVAVAIEVVQDPAPEVLRDILGLFEQTYTKATTKFERLTPRFFEQIARQPPSHWIIMREAESSDMIGFMLCFESGDCLINKFIGLDYSRPKNWVLYFRLWDAAVDFALSRGFKSIQSGQTGYSAKIEIGHKLVPLTNYCRHRNPLVHTVFRLVAKTITWQTLDEDLAAHLKAHPEDGISQI